MLKQKLFTLLLLLAVNITNAQVDSAATDTSLSTIEKPKVILKTNPIPILWGPIAFTSEYRLVAEVPLKGRESVSFMGSYLGENLAIDINDTSLSRRQNVNNVLIDENGEQYAWQVKSIAGYRLQFLYKHYMAAESPKGVYIGAHLSYAYAKYNVDWEPVGTATGQNPVGGNPSDYLSITYLNFNALAGYQTFAGKSFAFDVYGGLGVNQRSLVSSYEGQNFDSTIKGISAIVPKLILGLTFGIAIY